MSIFDILVIGYLAIGAAIATYLSFRPHASGYNRAGLFAAWFVFALCWLPLLLWAVVESKGE
jgi:uncharacterized membrane protein YecN with MAPEG domain